MILFLCALIRATSWYDPILIIHGKPNDKYFDCAYFSSSRYCNGFYRSSGDCCRPIESIRCHLASYQVIKVWLQGSISANGLKKKKINMNMWQKKLELEIYYGDKFGRGCLPTLNSTSRDGSLAIMVKFVVRFLPWLLLGNNIINNQRFHHHHTYKQPHPRFFLIKSFWCYSGAYLGVPTT